LLPKRLIFDIFTAHQGKSDAEQYCRAKGIALKQRRVVPLGADPIRIDITRAPQLPQGLGAGRYALFVSTIEPRKNHALLLSVWKRLRALKLWIEQPQARAPYKAAIAGFRHPNRDEAARRFFEAIDDGLC
jgi:glycosyltransferase involved in cell wall biosynthesis